MMIRACMLQFISRYGKRKQRKKNETSCNNDCTMQANTYIYAIVSTCIYSFLSPSFVIVEIEGIFSQTIVISKSIKSLNKYHSSLVKGLRFIFFSFKQLADLVRVCSKLSGNAHYSFIKLYLLIHLVFLLVVELQHFQLDTGVTVTTSNKVQIHVTDDTKLIVNSPRIGEQRSMRRSCTLGE